MKNVITTENVPIKIWSNDMDENAIKQAKNLANLPFVFKHVSLMPDFHMGYGMPIGGVMATRDVVIPNAVGYDIGCGMLAIRTNLTDISLEDIKKVMQNIRERVPVGFSRHSKNQEQKWIPDCSFESIDNYYEKAQKQIGTLGGGNHFIEIQKGSDDYLWIMIHSGSRNIGYQVAKYHNKIAVDINEKWFSQVHKEWQLAFLPIDSNEGQLYLKEMKFCVDFALYNRDLMKHNVKESFLDILPDSKFYETINIAHNYAEMEHHFGTNVMVHRKGATKAYSNQLGIIPGSQGSSSYIVSGLGNEQSFMSSSHGAGRKLGRKQAQKTLDFNTEKKHLDDLGIIHSIRNENDLDEATGAYKDIETVMENQRDLVEIKIKLIPLAVIKG